MGRLIQSITFLLIGIIVAYQTQKAAKPFVKEHIKTEFIKEYVETKSQLKTINNIRTATSLSLDSFLYLEPVIHPNRLPICRSEIRNTLTTWEKEIRGGLKISYLCFCNGANWISIPNGIVCNNGLCSPTACLSEYPPITL